jgi:DNA-binding transcriptional LysR family regulator
MDWADRIGRRVKLRDLHVMLAVAQMGSMSKAAERLAISHPVVSKTISDLEHALGVRLFDRTAHGVHLTDGGHAILDCGVAVFDELRRAVGRLDHLSDPTVGDLGVGATEPVMCGLILSVMQRLIVQYPRIKFHNVTGDTPSLHRALRERRVDFVVSRQWRSGTEDDLTAEILFDEDLVVVAGYQNPLARRLKIKLTDLLDEPWVLPERDNAAGQLIAEGFRSIGVGPLKPQTISNSIAIRMGLVKTMGFLTILPGSTLHFYPDRRLLKVLPVRLPMKAQPVEVVRLTHRTLAPVAETFLKSLRTIAKPLERMRC